MIIINAMAKRGDIGKYIDLKTTPEPTPPSPPSYADVKEGTRCIVDLTENQKADLWMKREETHHQYLLLLRTDEKANDDSQGF